jgi:hypothetical protein
MSMIDRRKLIKAAGASAVAVMAPSSTLSQSRVADSGASSRLIPADEEAEQILYELASFEARYYAEEGTCMVLACENLADKTSGAFVADATNRRFSEAFDHYAALLSELRSDLTEQDVAPVVELIAHRDFAAAGGSFEE